MNILRIDTSKALDRSELEGAYAEAADALTTLHEGSGAGSDYLGWLTLPSSFTDDLAAEIDRVAGRLRSLAEVVVVIGIGGSYLGAKAVTEAMTDSFECLKRHHNAPRVVFAGQNISEDYTAELLSALKDYSIAAIVISKSGTTTEPAIAFRLLKTEIEARYGKEGAAQRIVAVTDESKGALRELSEAEGYDTFVIPDDVGGRFSVLTPVGLLPLAVAGIDYRRLMEGALQMERATSRKSAPADNPALVYAAARNLLYRKGYKIEVLAGYEPKLQYLGEWWKQLYGESEGKQGKGIFPAGVTFTADLHSMGQYIQEGERILFETVVSIAEPAHRVAIEEDRDNLDGLNFLAGKRIGQVNRMAELGVALAHLDGGVPNIRIEIPRIDEYSIGALIYFFEKACGISGYILGVNPFDQPGVEAYKKNMFALLDKPGYQKESEEIRRRL